MTFAQPFLEYEILDRVGAGAMGTVFKARHKRLNRIVALKVLKPSLARDSRYVDRLRREARIVASLSHPFIVTGFDLGEESGYHYFVMEFVEGKSLRGLLVEWGIFAEEYVVRIARQVAQALDHAYQRGVIHRDIKPGNILIDEAGNVKLTDMGLAKGPTDLTLTRDGATVGTPQYISPEQARNPHDVDVRTDLYSLGATLYHMATGVPPFRGDTIGELITNVLHELPVSPKAINSALTEGMSLVIRKLLAKDLTVRYQTPRDLLDDLDRIEKALPPQIDPSRLSAEAGQRNPWLVRTLLAVGGVVLLGGAWWLGMQTQEPTLATPSSTEFLAALDARLRELPTPGAKLAHVRTITAAPVGCESELQLRHIQIDGELQRAVDAVVGELADSGWATLQAWLRDAAVWPNRDRVLRERLQPRLLKEAGLELHQLPSTVRMTRLEDLQKTIDRTLHERDAELLVRFDTFLKVKLPALVEEELHARNFAVAGRIWSEGMMTFCDGVRMPLPERLPEAVRNLLKERHLLAQQEAQSVLEAAEGDVDQALRAEVATACGEFEQQLEGDVEPEAVAAHLLRFRRDLGEVWPSDRCFRPARSPWPDIERQFGGLQLKLQAALLRREEEQFTRRCDLAWRTFCHGSANDALLLLPVHAPAGTTRAQRLQQHRTALSAAHTVEQAVVQAIARGNQPVVAFLRADASSPLELRAEPDGTSWRLLGNAIHQLPRPVQLTELRFSALLTRLEQNGDPLATVAAEQRGLGVAVSRLVGDDLAGLGALLQSLAADEQHFVFDEIWPRVLRVREERPETPMDRKDLFAQLQATHEAATKSGALEELETKLHACESHVPAAVRTNAEDNLLRDVTRWLRLARRQRDVLRDLGAAVPQGAGVEVRIVDGELVAEVSLAAAVLPVPDGWQRRGETLEFAGGGTPWSAGELQMLTGNTGIAPTAQHTSLVIDFVLPPTTVGRRFYVIEFRGIACVLVLGANDTVHAALVEGDARREDPVQQAFLRAFSGVMAPSKVVAVPGAVHRLTFDLQTTSVRTAALVKVMFEGVELFPPTRRSLDPQRPPTFTLIPQQDIVVRRIMVRAEGL